MTTKTTAPFLMPAYICRACRAGGGGVRAHAAQGQLPALLHLRQQPDLHHGRHQHAGRRRHQARRTQPHTQRQAVAQACPPSSALHVLATGAHLSAAAADPWLVAVMSARARSDRARAPARACRPSSSTSGHSDRWVGPWLQGPKSPDLVGRSVGVGWGRRVRLVGRSVGGRKGGRRRWWFYTAIETRPTVGSRAWLCCVWRVSCRCW